MSTGTPKVVERLWEVRTSCLGLSRKAAAHATTDEDEQADYSNDLG
jgi:hypothetical protein